MPRRRRPFLSLPPPSTARVATKLLASLALLYFLESTVPRVTPPGGLIPVDYGYAFTLIPLTILYAASPSRPLWPFALYGALAATLFLPGYLSNRRLPLYLARAPDYRAEQLRVLADWCGAISTSALACLLLALLRPHLIDRWLPSTRAASRRRRNLCPHCTYNLTANTSGTCPECGTPIIPLRPAQ